MVGEILKKRREELGRDLREISNNLKIRYDYLKALEDGDRESLPAEVYVKGYIREYAKTLDMDTETVLDAYAEQAGLSALKENGIPVEKDSRKTRIKMRYLLIPLLFGGLIIIAYVKFPVPQKGSQSAAPAVRTKVQNAAKVAAAAPELVLKVAATDTTWLLVTIDETDSKEILMKPGDSIVWHAKKGFFLKIGNAAGVRMVLNGKEIGRLGEKGQVIKINIPDEGV